MLQISDSSRTGDAGGYRRAVRTERCAFQQARADVSAFAGLYIQDSYQRQRVKWMAGKRATFPCGTVQLRRRAPIRCKPPDDDEPGIFELKRSLG